MEEIFMNQNVLNRADDVIMDKIIKGEIMGASLCVIHHNDTVYRKEFGMADQAKNIPMTRDSIFRCYSMTKPITSAAVMTLVERGLLSLNDTADTYLPGFHDQKVLENGKLIPVKRPVTIQDLLDMTAGVTYPDASFPAGVYMQNMIDKYYADLENGTPTTTGDLANLIGKQPLEFHPGEGWRYSFCADVLGAIIEVISGKTYGEYLQETIFTPLGMVDTDFYVPVEKQNRFMENYEYKPETGKLEPCTWQHLGLSYMHKKKPAFESGGAGLVSTVDDYSRFVQMMLNGGTYEDTRILGRKSIDYMTSDHLTPQQAKMYDWDSLYGYGYGNLMRQMVDVHSSNGLGSVGEFGWDGWLGSYVAMDPKEDLAMIYVIQKCGGNGYRDVQVLRNIIYSAL
jgi:CubicO group peptidase (beta-lactamase class C family)